MAETSNLEAALPDAAAEARIRAALAAYNQERPRVERKAVFRLLAFFGIWAFVSGLALWVALQSLALVLIAVLITAATAGYFAWRIAFDQARQFKQNLRDGIFPELFGFLDNVRYQHGSEPGSTANLPGNALVYRNEVQVFDTLAGRNAGMEFHLAFAVFTDGGPDSSRTTFRGVVLQARLNTPFPGELLTTHKFNGVSRFIRDHIGWPKLKVVTCGWERIDAHYDFLTDNPSAAAPLLQQGLVDVLAIVNRTWPGEQSRLAFKGQDCFLLVPMEENIFDLPSIDVPLDYQQHVVPMIKQVHLLLQAMQRVVEISAEPHVLPKQDSPS